MPKKPKLKSYPHYGENKWLDRLYKQLRKHGISFEEMLERTDLTEKRFTRNERGGFAKTARRKQKPMEKSIIQKLFLEFPFLNLGNFVDRDNETQGERNDKNLFTSNDWKRIKPFIPSKSALIDAVSFPKDTNNNPILIEAYKRIAPYFAKAKKCILVFELTSKGNNVVNKLTAYQKAQAEIYQAIEKALKYHKEQKEQTGFTYTRVFSLSNSEKYFPKTITNVEEMKTAFVAESSLSTFFHIKTCLKHYPEFCKFYVIGPSVFRHHALIDSDFYLTEDYMQISDTIYPDCLYIDDITKNPKIRAFAEAFVTYIEQSEPKHLITKENNDVPRMMKEHDITMYLKKAQEHLLDKIENIGYINKKLSTAKYDYNDSKDYMPETIKELIERQSHMIEIMEKISLSITFKLRVFQKRNLI